MELICSQKRDYRSTAWVPWYLSIERKRRLGRRRGVKSPAPWLAIALVTFPPPAGKAGSCGIPWRQARPVAPVTVSDVSASPPTPRGPYKITCPLRQCQAVALNVTSVRKRDPCAVIDALLQLEYTERATQDKHSRLGLYWPLTMAVTEARCDLTYCKMRGVMAILTGMYDNL